ncbi:Peroxidase-like protein [Mizuhopecten yessoensis]|uniref:Peroxidase-like protein n=1 Tax=Mizuhopecten yessoensis TaxID=6573 RepID=A0A210Q9N0_MIZYE|nr:Peroxidase-like protein [Mizuhopecten yessoensis]
MVMAWGQFIDHDFIRTPISSGGLKMKGNGLPGRPTGCVIDQSPNDYCYHAGDERVNTVPSLGTTHIIFLRDHTRIANELTNINPMWTDEIIFQETRKIISAFNQQITYGEFLPVLLNEKLMKNYGLNNAPCHSDVYDETVNAATGNAFDVAVFRFGHTLIPHFQGLMNDDLVTIEKFKTETTFNRPFLIQKANGTNQYFMTRWMTVGPAGRMDRIFEKAILDLLFVDSNGDSFDLPSLNIQRGRDHGTPGYNDWRRWCNLPRATHFGSNAGGLVNHTPDNAMRLGNVYQDVDDIDLFAGGITETHIEGGGIGPTFACMLGRQFKNFKIGDRFWYEQPPQHLGGTGFTKGKYKKIRQL